MVCVLGKKWNWRRKSGEEKADVGVLGCHLKLCDIHIHAASGAPCLQTVLDCGIADPSGLAQQERCPTSGKPGPSSMGTGEVTLTFNRQ